MEFITATHWWKIMNTNPYAWIALLAKKHNVVKGSTKLITPLHSKRYWLLDVLIHHQNSYAPHSQWCTGVTRHSNIWRAQVQLRFSWPHQLEVIGQLHRERAPNTHWRGGCVGYTASWKLWRREVSYSYQDSNPGLPSHSP